METIKHQVDFCVVGGGIAGMFAAIEAARHGVKTILMHERPVLGGNASSEIRMWICGCQQFQETGLIEEIRLENLYRNNYPNYSVWDSILFEKVKFQENLTCILNCSCQSLKMDGSKIKSVTGWQQTTQTFQEVEAKYFADCSGDSILAPLSGAKFRIGRESASEFGETLAPDEADRKTMGMSCLIQARETDKPQKFIPPFWANKYPDEKSFPEREHLLRGLQNFWWLELGGNRDSIGDTEDIRDELLKVAFGIWDHIKNHGEHGAENWVLEWVGFLPGKRESRRYVGDYIFSEKDVLSGDGFDDVIAYGGWPLDDHHPDGFDHFDTANTFILPKKPYGIPLRSLYSQNIDNLMFAGRNISASHIGLSSTRVMATCGLLGQAVGALVYHANHHGITPRDACRNHIKDIQHTLLDDDCALPGIRRKIPALSLNAKLIASNGNPEGIHSGFDREMSDEVSSWSGTTGDFVEYEFAKESQITEIRLVFDSELDRGIKRFGHLNMPALFPQNMQKYSPPDTLIRGYHIEADGKEIYRETENYQRFIRLKVDVTTKKLRFVIDSVYGNGEKKLFAFDVR